MVPIMITGPDTLAVMPGHSHGVKCAVKCHYKTSCSKCTTCGTWDHRDKSSRICFQAGPAKPHPGIVDTERNVILCDGVIVTKSMVTKSMG